MVLQSPVWEPGFEGIGSCALTFSIYVGDGKNDARFIQRRVVCIKVEICRHTKFTES